MARILVAQQDSSHQAVEAVEDPSAEEDAHAAGGGEGTLHEGTEAHGGAAAEHSAFPPFDATTFPSQLLWLAITFAALYLLMSRLALPRIGEILEVRRDRIEGDLAEAERMRQKTDQAIEDYETALAEARSKAHSIAEETRARVKADLDARREKVEADLATKMAEAEGRIDETKREAMSNVNEIAAETAQAVVTRLVGKVQIKTARDTVAKVVKEQAQ